MIQSLNQSTPFSIVFISEYEYIYFDIKKKEDKSVNNHGFVIP